VNALQKDIGTKELDVNLSPRGPIGPVGLCPLSIRRRAHPCWGVLAQAEAAASSVPASACCISYHVRAEKHSAQAQQNTGKMVDGVMQGGR
jgi:hypothetical protein